MHFKATFVTIAALVTSALALPSPQPISDAISDLESRQTIISRSDVLVQHNKNRAQYSAGPLTWSDELYPGAQEWANACKFQHSEGNYGENLAAGFGSFGISQAVELWMSEASQYDYNNPGFSAATGHFTQVVWKSTTQVACAVANCGAGTIFSQPSVYVVCRYSPAGNVQGQFPQNVGRHI